MNNYHKELLLELIDEWNDAQLDGYIFHQEERLEHTRQLIRDLKEIRRKRYKRKQKPLDAGVRGGL
jgi:hypothetical protein